MKTIFDGVKLMVQFYDNNRALHKVQETTGIPIKRLQNFLDNDILSEKDRETLVSFWK